MLGFGINRALFKDFELVNPATQPLRIGLTGGIGCGKTTVCEQFVDLGIAILDADIVAREIVQPNEPAYLEIVEFFGSAVLASEGQINRKKLREEVFNQADKLKKLEKITHPRIISTMRARSTQMKSPYCILCFPLLFEKNLQAEVDRIAVVDLPSELQKQRVISRDQVSLEQVEAIMNNQLSREERLALADDVISNNGSLEDLQSQVQTLHEKYLCMVNNK